MSDSILGGNWAVYYEAENRQKRLEWTGSATGTNTVNELYSALQDQFDELQQMDDGTPMSAQTPTEYTIGIIDSGDDDPWFIDRTSVEHLTGGAIQTASWTRSTGSNTGIVRVEYSVGTGNDFVTGDIGLTVTSSEGDSGTLLDFNSTGATNYAWIRPADDTAANDWDVTAGSPTTTIVVTGGTGDVTQDASAATGESLWAGIFSIGTIADNTHIYVVQNGAVLTAYKAATDWWSDGQIDILVNVKEVEVESDEAVITVFARRYGATFDNFETDLSAGGRNPIPLATGTDLNNATGYRTVTLSSSSGTWSAGDVLENNTLAAGESKAIVTGTSGSNPTITLEYYLIGDPIVDFANGNTIINLTASESPSPTGIAGTPADFGPALTDAGSPNIVIQHRADETFDIDEDGTPENYSIVIDCQNLPLSTVYEWTKYILRRAGATTTDTDGLEAQQYIGSDRKIAYTSINGTLAEGTVVTQVGTGATGTIVAHNETDNFLILRNSRGTFNTSGAVEDAASPSSFVTGLTITVLTPIKAAPFGTFAGGTWFCAPGVVLSNVPAADANNYQLTDDDANVVLAPTKVTATISNTRASDRVALFRLTGSGGQINKAEYNGTAQSAGATSLIVGSNITADTPASGAVRLVDVDADVEYRWRYSSFSTATFTLASTTGLTADGGTDTTQIEDAAGNFSTNAVVGDLIRNVTAGGYGFVTAVNSNTNISTTTIAGQTSGDSYEINTLPVATTTSDTVYVPLIDIEETTGTDGSPGNEQALITYLADISVRARVRQGKVILPFETDGTITSSGLTISAIRTPDTIAV